jgi:multiple sugar transport system permease protein
MGTEKNHPAKFDYQGILFIAPAIIVICFVTLYPYFYAIFISFHQVVNGAIGGFHGFQNYFRVLGDDSFHTSVRNQLIILFVSGSLQFLLGFIGALALNGTTKFTYVLRSLVLVPWVLPGVVCGLLWQWIFNGNVGVLNFLLFNAGIIKKYLPWLSNGQFALSAILTVNIWRVYPFMLVMYLSGLQSIPMEQYEAAYIDGANSGQRLRYITLPNMKPIIVMTLILSSIWNFKIFDIIWTLTAGGPNGATEVFSTLIYKYSFQRMDFGFSSAVAVIMAVIIGIPILLYLKIGKAGDVNGIG